MGKGLIPADGEVWRVRRRAIVPALHKKVSWSLCVCSSHFNAGCCQLVSCSISLAKLCIGFILWREASPLLILFQLCVVQYVAAMISLFGQATDRLCRKLDEAASNGEDVEMESLFSRLTLDIIGKAVFNYDFDSLKVDTGIVEVFTSSSITSILYCLKVVLLNQEALLENNMKFQHPN